MWKKERSMNKITIKELKEKLNDIPDDTEVDLTTDQLFNLLYPNSTVNKFKFVIGDWSDDGHSHYDEFTYISETPLIELQNAFKDACKEYGLIFDTNNNLKVESNFRYIFCDYEDSSISIELLEHFEKIGIDIDSIFGYNLKEYELFKQTRKLNHTPGWDKSYDFARLHNGLNDLSKLIIALIKLKLPNAVIEYDSIQARKAKPFNGWWIDNDMNLSLGYGLYWN